MSDNLTAVLYDLQDMRLEQRPVPKPGPEDVLLHVASVGICGSDVAYWWRGRTVRNVVETALVLGHESSAKVVTCGSDVHNLKPGDRVAIEPGVPCRKCEYCKGGQYNVCPEMRFCATPPVDGTLTKHFVHPADLCFKLPKNVSDEEGAMLEPLAMAVYSCRRAEVGGGSIVLVLGAGSIGLLTLLTAKAMGAASVCITDINEGRLRFAKTLGANRIINVSGQSEVEVAARIQHVMPSQPTAIIECSGADSSYKIGILASAPRGVMVLAGRGKPDVTLPIIEAATKEMDIRGVYRYANCYPAALALVSSGLVNVRPLVTHRFPLTQVVQAFQTAKDGAAIKVMIQVDQRK